MNHLFHIALAQVRVADLHLVQSGGIPMTDVLTAALATGAVDAAE